MSLIQVSSTQRGLDNIGNKGFRFSSYFDSVLKIPPNSEIALDEAIITIATGNEVYLESTDGGIPNVFRVLISKKSENYANDSLKEYVNSTCNPMIVFVPKGTYPSVNSFWKNNINLLNLNPHPQYCRTFNTFSSVTGTTISQTFQATSNTATNADYLRDGLRIITNTDYDNLENDVYIKGNVSTILGVDMVVGYEKAEVGTGPSNKDKIAYFLTQHSGIHIAKGSVGAGSWSCPNEEYLSLLGTYNYKHYGSLGITRWRDPKVNWIDYENLTTWWGNDNLSSQVNSFDDFFDYDATGIVLRVPEDEIPAFGQAQLNFLADSFGQDPVCPNGLPKEYAPYNFGSIEGFDDFIDGKNVGEYWFQIHPKFNLQEYKSSGRLEWIKDPNSSQFNGLGLTISILKIESLAKNYNDTTGKVVNLGHDKRLVCIASGDAGLTEAFGIPYAGHIDPGSASFSSIGSPNSDGFFDIWGQTLPLVSGYFRPSIHITGNQVSFKQGVTDIVASRTFAGFPREAEAVVDYLSDMTFPLQFFGSLSGTGDVIGKLQYTEALSKKQENVPCFGSRQTSPTIRFNEYVRRNSIIPNGLFNIRRQSPKTDMDNEPTFWTPSNYYPIQSSGAFYSAERSPQLVDTTSAGVGQELVNENVYLCLGGFAGANQFNVPYGLDPNVAKKLSVSKTDIEKGNVYLDAVTQDYVSAKGSYELNAYADPFKRGIHVMLNQLPNNSSCGSMGQAHTSKLIDVINRYDSVNEADDSENSVDTQQIYSYNKYERLYVSLNNPHEIELSDLNVTLVDRFGSYLKGISETLLTFHLRHRC